MIWISKQPPPHCDAWSMKPLRAPGLGSVVQVTVVQVTVSPSLPLQGVCNSLAEAKVESKLAVTNARSQV